MTDPKKLAHEGERLSALHSALLLGTPAEPLYDCVARIAAHIFGVPSASVSLIDHDRQWFKGSAGGDLTGTTQETSFCAYVVESKVPMLVRDTSEEDRRFAHRTSVSEAPQIRFYVGAPVVTQDGFAVGTVCVLDSTARNDVDVTKMSALCDLASIVARQATSSLMPRGWCG